MKDKMVFDGIVEISHEVRAWQEGSAEFDYVICGEFVVKDTDNHQKYINQTCLPTGEGIYIVSKYSAFDQDHFDEEDYIIEEYYDEESLNTSKYKKYFHALQNITDSKFDEIMEMLDDTKNFPNGRSFVGSVGGYTEWYCDILGKYIQIRQKEGETIYSVSDESYYLVNYMSGFYPAYFHGRTKEQHYLEEVTSLDEFQWDSPYPFYITQYRGMTEINNRHSPYRDFGYSDEETVQYSEKDCPIFLSVTEQKAEDGHPNAYIAMIGFITDHNTMNYIYTAEFVESGNIEYCVTTKGGHQKSGYYKKTSDLKDIVYKKLEIALKTEWGNYFLLLDVLRSKRKKDKIDIHWRTGSKDKYNIMSCTKLPLNEDEYVIWAQKITEQMYTHPEKGVDSSDSDYVIVLELRNRELSVEDLEQWIKEASYDEWKKIDLSGSFLAREGSKYYHINTNKGRLPLDYYSEKCETCFNA